MSITQAWKKVINMARTLAEAQAFLDAVETAYTAALSGKTVSYNGRSVGYQDIDVLAAELDRWQKAVNTLTASAAGATNPGVKIATWT